MDASRPGVFWIRTSRGSSAGPASDEIVSPLARLRLRLIHTVPAVRGRALQVQSEAAREIAERLAEAFPDRLTRVSAGALTGAFIGAVTGALSALLEDTDEPGDPATLELALETATEVALAPWRDARSG